MARSKVSKVPQCALCFSLTGDTCNESNVPATLRARVLTSGRAHGCPRLSPNANVPPVYRQFKQRTSYLSVYSCLNGQTTESSVQDQTRRELKERCSQLSHSQRKCTVSCQSNVSQRLSIEKQTNKRNNPRDRGQRTEMQMVMVTRRAREGPIASASSCAPPTAN